MNEDINNSCMSPLVLAEKKDMNPKCKCGPTQWRAFYRKSLQDIAIDYSKQKIHIYTTRGHFVVSDQKSVAAITGWLNLDVQVRREALQQATKAPGFKIVIN